MKVLRIFQVLCLAAMAFLMAANQSSAQPTNIDTNAPAFTGQFAGLAKLASKSDESGPLPAKLSGLLWPDAAKHIYKVQKLSMPDKHGERFFLLRTDNQDVVLVHRTESQPDETTKYRKDYYYRATINGDLVLALSAKFRFEIDDVDNELLKDLTYDTYGSANADAKSSHPMTPEVRKKFEAEKKYWLGMQKKVAKTLHSKEKSE